MTKIIAIEKERNNIDLKEWTESGFFVGVTEFLVLNHIGQLKYLPWKRVPYQGYASRYAASELNKRADRTYAGGTTLNCRFASVASRHVESRRIESRRVVSRRVESRRVASSRVASSRVASRRTDGVEAKCAVIAFLHLTLFVRHMFIICAVFPLIVEIAPQLVLQVVFAFSAAELELYQVVSMVATAMSVVLTVLTKVSLAFIATNQTIVTTDSSLKVARRGSADIQKMEHGALELVVKQQRDRIVELEGHLAEYKEGKVLNTLNIAALVTNRAGSGRGRGKGGGKYSDAEKKTDKE